MMGGAAIFDCVTFSILEFLEQIEESNEPGKYKCPACGGNDFTINKKNGAYNCWHDTSAAHRAEVRDALAPLTRWEKPPRAPERYKFNYENKEKRKVVVVHSDDSSGSKKIWQEFPTVTDKGNSHKVQLQEAKASILPYKYNEAVALSEESGLPIFVVEGELTCEAVWGIGIPCVTFLGGSKQYRTNGDYSHLFRNNKLVLCPDRDEQGIAFMAEVATDNPGASWCYADPRSWEWENLPSGNGYDIGDYILEGATKEDILSSIVAKSRHKGQDGKPSYEEIISSIEGFVGLYANDARIAYEASNWLDQRGVKMSQQNIDKIVDEAKGRIYGREEIEAIDALSIAQSEQCREWLIAGILPLGSVMLLAASGGTGKSTLIYNWALDVAMGKKWSGRHCIKGRCLIIQSDEPLVDTSEKLNVIGYQDVGLEPGSIAFWENWRFAHLKQLEDYVRKHRPVFVAIDSLTACLAGMDMDLTKSNAGDVIYGIRDIANTYKCSFVILHHLNKSGGLRDSTSFVDNVSEVVKLTRSIDFDSNEFIFEWMKSRSGLTGKHVLQRDPLNYGWHYAGPQGGSSEELDKVVAMINMRKNERFTRQQAAASVGSWEISTVGKLLEAARRQGLITSSFQDGPNGEKQRLYHSRDYVAPDLDFTAKQSVAHVEAPAETNYDDFF